jgi:hypothetical protein
MYMLDKLYGSEVYLATSPEGTGAVLNLEAITYSSGVPQKLLA